MPLSDVDEIGMPKIEREREKGRRGREVEARQF